MERFGLRDDQWDRIKEAILYRFRTGIPWRDLPARFGYWKSVHQRFGRLGEERGF